MIDFKVKDHKRTYYRGVRFKVEWIGYDGLTYQSNYNDIKDSLVFHDFVRNHRVMKRNLEQWIPEEFLDPSSGLREIIEDDVLL